MQRQITELHHGHSNVLHTPYTLAVFSCGHMDKLPGLDVGDSANCDDCDRVRANLEKLKGLVEAGEVSHTRSRFSRHVRHGGGYRIDVYRRAPESPTGVRLALSVEDAPEVQEYMDSLLGSGLTPLSPTERP